jgi:hypothetical protein
MMLFVAAAMAAQPNMSPIDIPYQAIPSFMVYSDCVSGHFHDDERRRSGDVAQVRQANLDAIAACREVRAAQLERALAAQTDIRLYRSPANARAAVREAFDRFDRDFQVEPTGAAAEAPKEN